jgi:hypothetical protein
MVRSWSVYGSRGFLEIFDGLWMVHVMVEDVVGQQALAVHLVARRSQVKPDRALEIRRGSALAGMNRE